MKRIWWVERKIMFSNLSYDQNHYSDYYVQCSILFFLPFKFWIFFKTICNLFCLSHIISINIMYSEEFDSKMKTIDSWHKWSNKSIIKFYYSIYSIVLINHVILFVFFRFFISYLPSRRFINGDHHWSWFGLFIFEC